MKPTTKKAWLKIRARVGTTFVSLLAAIALVPSNSNFVGHLIDAGIHGLSIPAWAAGVIPAGTALVVGAGGWVATHFGDPDSLRFFQHGLTATVLGKVPDTTDVPDPTPTPAPGPSPFTLGTHADDVKELAAQMLAKYANTNGVEITTNPQDFIGPHGVNQPGETDPEPVRVA